jgi:hypothetical protein
MKPVEPKDYDYHCQMGTKVTQDLDGFRFTVTFCGQGNGTQSYLIWYISGEWPDAEKLAKYLDPASFGGRWQDYSPTETERVLKVYID